MATSFRLDPHEYLTLVPGSYLAENELFLVGFADAPWKTLTLVMNRWRVYVVLSRQNKWLSITQSFSCLPATHHPNPLFRDSAGFQRDQLPALGV